MLLFNRAAIIRKIEKGLARNPAGVMDAPRHQRMLPAGVFVAVPPLRSPEEVSRFAAALAIEAGHLLGDANPGWIELQGEAVNALAPEEIKSIAVAVYSAPHSLGMDINLNLLAPGELAGLRSVGVERFNFHVDRLDVDILEPVRRARAMGAFASVELKAGQKLSGKHYLKAVDEALAASPSQISLRDGCVKGNWDGALLEKAAVSILNAGFRRESLWVFTQVGQSFDSLGRRLAGRCASIGPGAVAYTSVYYENPKLERWLETRLNGNLEMTTLQDNMKPWMDLAGGIYAMHVRRDALDSKMLAIASGLEQMGAIDGQGRPKRGWPMEVCHRTAMAALQAFATL